MSILVDYIRERHYKLSSVTSPLQESAKSRVAVSRVRGRNSKVRLELDWKSKGFNEQNTSKLDGSYKYFLWPLNKGLA